MPLADRRPLTPTPVLPPSNQLMPGTLSLPLTVVRTCKDEGVQRWETRMEKGRQGLLLIAQLSQQCCTRSHAISSSTSPSKLHRNPRNLTMSWDRVPKHGTEKKKVSSLEPSHFFFLWKPCCWYLICSILSSSFKSPPATPSDPSRGPI